MKYITIKFPEFSNYILSFGSKYCFLHPVFDQSQVVPFSYCTEHAAAKAYGERMYSSTNSHPRRKLVISGQIHSPAD